MMNEESRKKLGEFISRIRQERGLSFGQMAKATGFAKSYLFDVENGEATLPPLSRLRVIARALDLDEADLLEAAGYLPEMGAYLRAKYDLPEPTAGQVEKYVRFMQEQAQEEGGRDEPPTDTEHAA